VQRLRIAASLYRVTPIDARNSDNGDHGIFERMAEHNHEQVVFCYEPTPATRASSPSTTPRSARRSAARASGTTERRGGLIDVLRLARGMTYKAAVAGLNLGGGKAVIIGDPKTTRREMIFRAHGRFVESLGGRYYTAEDVGTSVEDMDYVQMETEYVTGVAGGSGDPSPVTAYGTYRGIKACARRSTAPTRSTA
jgi:leucine dehydrogenase